MNIKVLILKEGAVWPSYQTEGAAGADVSACLDNPINLRPGDITIVPTGIALEIPKGYEVQVRARSGLAAKHGIGLVNGVGTIDSDYRGELKVIMINFGSEDFVIENGMRIAQIVVARHETAKFEEVNRLTDSRRGENRFGSTGN